LTSLPRLDLGRARVDLTVTLADGTVTLRGTAVVALETEES
jgi:hypothetical protein